MILHFLLDEKVVDKIIDNFERVAPGQNIYCICGGNGFIDDLKHIKHNKNKIIGFNAKNEDINFLIKKHQIKAIICHLLTADTADVVLRIKNRIKIFWVIWGYDVYSLPRIRPTLYAPITKQYLLKHKKTIKIDWVVKRNVFLRKIFYLLANKRNSFQLLEEAHKKIDYCTTYLKEDFELFKEYYPNEKIKFLHVAFQTIEQYVGNLKDNIEINDRNILIGNSNSVECNHLDVLNFLNKHDIGSSKVYVPLSYGSDNDYRNIVVSTGEKLLKEQFVPLLGFLQLKDYMEIQMSCSTGIFYHYRQQAMGNIIAMLWLGARLYFHNSNPAFKYLNRIGAKVYDLDADFKKFTTTKMNKEDITLNKRILVDIFSEKEVFKNYQNLIKEALK